MRNSTFLFLLCSLTIPTSSLASVRYVITDTGVVPNGSGAFYSQYHINASGDVAGWDNTSFYSTPRNFVYSFATHTTTYFTPTGSYGGAGINDAGVAVGTYTNAANQTVGFTYQDGVTTDLPGFFPVAINNAGIILGHGPAGISILDHGTLTPLPPSVASGTPIDLSDNGTVLGIVDGSTFTYAYPSTTLTNLGQLMTGAYFPQAINDAGQIVGYAVPQNSPIRAFLYSNGTLSIPFPSDPSAASDITNNSIISGSDGANGPALLQNGVTTFIKQRLAPNSSSWILTSGAASNATGQAVISGHSPTTGGRDHLLIATPTPFNTLSPVRPDPALNLSSGQQSLPLDVPDTSTGVVDFTSPTPFGPSNHPLVLLHLNNADPAVVSSLVSDRSNAAGALTLLSDASFGWQLDLWHSLQSRFGPTWTCAAFYTNYTGPSTFSFAWDFPLAPATALDRLLLTPLTCDLNLDGRLDPDDYALLDRGLARHLTGWTNGDLNADGTINQNDYLLLDTAYGQSHPLSPAFLSQRESQFGPTYVSTLLSAVPEPTSLSLLLLPTLLGLTRRRT